MPNVNVVLSNEQWLNMFSNLLIWWFFQEREHLHPDSPTLLQILDGYGLLDIDSEMVLDSCRFDN